MLAKFKLGCQVLLIASLVGLSVANAIDWNVKPFALGVLYSIANVVIFIL